MASSSSLTPSTQKSYKYDVFLSFRGEDTGSRSFAHHLYVALKDIGIYTYKDDEKIKKGDELIRSIEDSRFSIIVFSKNYASSAWCLNELVKIMECHKKNEQTVYRVFYGVEPTQVRNQSGAVGEAFDKLKMEESAGKWRRALKEAANLSGWELKDLTFGVEAKLINIIIQDIFFKLDSFRQSSFGGKLIGMETRLQDLESSLDIGVNDVRMIGIKGMGGAGKTTLAGVIFDRLSFKFDGGSFVKYVREVSESSVSGLRMLQTKILRDVFNDENITISGVHEGKNVMKNIMLRRKVLIVVDDVDHIDQLQALAGEPNWFKPGSRIIITTRDEQILIAHRVQLIHDVNLLTDLEAITLFSRYAFGTDVPIQGYEKLSRNFVTIAAGLPLSIKVWGSFLCGQDKYVWIEALERQKTIPLEVTLKKLELTYFGLEKDQKEIFLYVACLLKGWVKDKAIRLLESWGFHAASGLKVLQRRSLITIDDDQVLGMHYHIEEMGKSIVRRLHPDDPKRYSRLKDIRASDMDTDVTRGVVVDTPVNLSSEIVTTGFGKMKKHRELNLVSEISSMASPSLTSSIQKRFKYDVFLSFKGEDTGKNFVHHLYDALLDRGIETYKGDEKIKKREKMDDELIRSIDDSRFYIIVFSKNYASSSWCLNELVKIMDCQKKNEQTVYPLFYDVKSSEVRNQSGAIGEAFIRHNNKEEAGKWREALKEASNLAGWELKATTNGNEAKFIQKIVEVISLELRFVDGNLDGDLVGMERRMNAILSCLEMGLDDVRMIGIKGMGGAGKTTLARAIFDRLSFQFDGGSFVENVREVSRSSLSGLKTLQQQIISDVLNDEGITVSSVNDGKNMIKKMMRGRKILLVLDDVDQINQLEALAGELNWFKPGSRIIITTRDEQVLLAHGVNLICDVNLLSNIEAFCLFSRYAFGRKNPIQGYEKLSWQIVDYAAGLPLTIKVLGSLLCGNDERYWEDTLAKLKVIPLQHTLNILELSYSGLEDHYKEIFLDVACFMNGLLKMDAIRILESRGFFALQGLRTLEQKSLLTIPNGRLRMYRHIQEMGWNIVRREHPDEPNRHSRLWIQKEVKNILNKDLGTIATRFLRLKPVELSPEIVMKGLGNLKRLQVLLLAEKDDDLLCSDWKFDKMKEYFPNSLRFLNWEGYPLWCLPLTFQAKNLISLEMYNSRIEQLWEEGEFKVLKKLRFLDLSNSALTTLDLGMTPNLERLDLKKCHDLEKLYAPVGSLERLVYLNLTDCSSFKSLSLIKQLESRNLFTFSKLDLIVKSSGEYPKYSHDNLQLLLFTCSYFEEASLPNGNPLKFVSLNLKPATKLVSVSESICCLQHLRQLTINGCIPELPNDLSRLEYLENLSLKSTHIKCLPDSICMLKHLKSLELESCLHLEKLPANLDQFECLEKLNLVSTHITYLPDSICMLRSLKSLNLELCELLKKLPEGLGQLGCLEKLVLTKCTSLKDIPNSICNMMHLVYLHLPFCSLVEKLPEELGSLICLKELNVDRTGISRLPQCISLLKDLRIIGSFSVLQSCGSASRIQTSDDGTFFYIQQ